MPSLDQIRYKRYIKNLNKDIQDALQETIELLRLGKRCPRSKIYFWKALLNEKDLLNEDKDDVIR
jgi:hypothetical protein